MPSGKTCGPMLTRVEGARKITERSSGMVGAAGGCAGVAEVSGDTARGRRPCIDTGVPPDGAADDRRSLCDGIEVRQDGRRRIRHRRHFYLSPSKEPQPGGPVPLGPEIGR